MNEPTSFSNRDDLPVAAQKEGPPRRPWQEPAIVQTVALKPPVVALEPDSRYEEEDADRLSSE
jgi:hypothetical protein